MTNNCLIEKSSKLSHQKSEWGPKFGIKTRTPTDWIGYYCMLDFQVETPLTRIGYRFHIICKSPYN